MKEHLLLEKGELARHVAYYLEMAKAGEPHKIVQHALTQAYDLIDLAAQEAERQNETLAAKTLGMVAGFMDELANVQPEPMNSALLLAAIKAIGEHEADECEFHEMAFRVGERRVLLVDQLDDDGETGEPRTTKAGAIVEVVSIDLTNADNPYSVGCPATGGSWFFSEAELLEQTGPLPYVANQPMIFNSSSARDGEPSYRERSKQIVTILRPLTADEADLDEVGPMYVCRFADGLKVTAFHDELTEFYGQYKILADFSVRDFDYRGESRVQRFVETMQDKTYDEGGVAGAFEVIGDDSSAVLRVEFTREYSDDRELAEKLRPDNIIAGLWQQLADELKDAKTPAPYELLPGVEFLPYGNENVRT